MMTRLLTNKHILKGNKLAVRDHNIHSWREILRDETSQRLNMSIFVTELTNQSRRVFFC